MWLTSWRSDDLQRMRGRGLGGDSDNGRGGEAQACDEDAAMVADTDLERLIDKLMEEDDLEGFMREETPWKHVCWTLRLMGMKGVPSSR